MTFTLRRPDLCIVEFSNGEQIRLHLTTENKHGEHLKITSDDTLIMIPGAANQIRVLPETQQLPKYITGKT